MLRIFQSQYSALFFFVRLRNAPTTPGWYGRIYREKITAIAARCYPNGLGGRDCRTELSQTPREPTCIRTICRLIICPLRDIAAVQPAANHHIFAESFGVRLRPPFQNAAGANITGLSQTQRAIDFDNHPPGKLSTWITTHLEEIT